MILPLGSRTLLLRLFERQEIKGEEILTLLYHERKCTQHFNLTNGVHSTNLIVRELFIIFLNKGRGLGYIIKKV